MIYSLILFLFTKNSYSVSKLIRSSAFDITQQMENSPKSIVFVSDDENSIEFAYSAIKEYKDQVKFFLTSPSEVPSSFYTTDPSIIAFKYTKPWKIESPPLDSTSFSYWVQRVIDPTHYTIALPQQLEKILDGSTPVLFNIYDKKPQPAKITEKDEITVFESKSSLFQNFNIKVSPGLYAYRPQDKHLIPYNGSFSLQVSSQLTYYSLIDPNSNKIIIAFIIDEWGKESTDQYELLEKLSNLYGCDKYYYTLIDSTNAHKLFKGIGIYSIKRPICVISDTSNPHHRWIYNQTTDGEIDFESLKKFVSEVVSNQREPTVISEPIPDYQKVNYSSVQPIVNSNFGDLVYDDTYETVVMFIREENKKSKILLIFFKAIAKIIDNKYTKFYTFNVTNNDMPNDVPEATTYPMVVMWPAGKKDQPKVFSGEITFQGVFDFVKECASHKLAIPKFDLKEVLQSITEKVSKIIKKEEKQDL